MRRLVQFSLLSSAIGLGGLSLLVLSPTFQRILDIVDRTMAEPEVVTRIVEVPVPAPVSVNTNIQINNQNTSVSNGFAAVFDGFWDDWTCTVQTQPAGATVWRKNLFGEPEYLGVTPIKLDRPPRSEIIYLQAPGYQTAEAWLIPPSSHQACHSQLSLLPATG